MDTATGRGAVSWPRVIPGPQERASQQDLIGYLMSLALISARTILMLLSASPTEMLLL
jgi:hypothetical protein